MRQALQRLPRQILPASLLLGALLVNFARIDSKSFGLDESTSVEYSRRSLGQLLAVLTRLDPNMSVYYFVLKGWMKLFGEGEVAVRSVSALAAASAVVAMYALAARLFGRAAGIVAALLLMLNAFHVEFAQTARSYGLVVLLTILSSYFFVLEIERPSKTHRIGYAIVATLAFYTHHFAALVLLVHGLVLIAKEGRAGLTAGRLRMAATVVLLCAPEAVIGANIGAAARLGWVRPASAETVRWALLDLAGRSAAVLCLLVLLGCYGMLLALREGRLWPHTFAAAWFAIPILVTLAASIATPMFVSKFLIVCVPGLILFAAAGVARIRFPVVAAPLVVLLAGLAARQLRDHNRAEGDENWRDATRYVLEASMPGDGIKFFPDYNRRPFDYYQRLTGRESPANLENQPLVGPTRIWLVDREYESASRPEAFQRVRTELLAGYRVSERRDFSRVGVELFVR